MLAFTASPPHGRFGSISNHQLSIWYLCPGGWVGGGGAPPCSLREWSLITGRGSYKTGGGGGQAKFYPTKKKGGGGVRTSFSHAEWGRGTTSFEVALTWKLNVLAIVLGIGAKSLHPLKKREGGGRKKLYPVLRGVEKVLNPRFFHFVAPTPSA